MIESFLFNDLIVKKKKKIEVNDLVVIVNIFNSIDEIS